MGWLWACLGGGPNIQGTKRSKSLRRKLSNQPHDLRLQPLPNQFSRHGYGVHEASHLQKVPSRGRAGDSEHMEAFKIPISSVNTCISINTLKKASEKNLESSFRSEFGVSMRSDVDELKDELAALRRRLANEEAEAKKLREEVSYLRSCGVLQRPEDSPDMRIFESLPEIEFSNDSGDDQANETLRQGDIAPVKQFRRCFSGPMLFDFQSTSTNDSRKDSSESTVMVPQTTQTRISSYRVGLSPKPHTFVQKAQLDGAHKGEEGVDTTTEPNSRVSKVSLTSGLHQYPSTKVAAWTNQITEESHRSRDFVVLDSMDVHWIEVASAPCPSGFSTNVRRDDPHSQDYAESPRRPKLRTLMAEDDTSKNSSQKLVGKRRSKRSVDFNEPTEKRSKEQSLTSNQPPALTPEQIEEQLSQAVAAFRQQKRELELKHQSFCHGPTAVQQPAANNPGVVSFFRNSRKKSHGMRHRGFQRSLSPVKEALSIEEVTWSRQSSSRNECAAKPEDSSNSTEIVGVSTGTQGFKFSAKLVEDSSPVKLPPEEMLSDDERPSAMENIAMVPIQCVSPSLSPKMRSASSALDAFCALAMSNKTPSECRYHLEESVEGGAWIQDWDDDMDMKPIECASPSFADRRAKNNPRGQARQSISFEPKESSPLVASSGEESFVSTLPAIPQSESEYSEWGMAGNAGKSTPSPSAFRSPSKQGRSSVTPSPRKQWSPSKQCSPSKQWSPSPRKDMESSPMVNERSWYCDAIDAIQSINDIRRSKEGRLHTESVSLGNSPAGKSSSPRPRPPHAFSAEKKMLRRAFSWYVSEHDERMRTFGLKGRSGSKEPEEDDNGAQKPLSVPSRAPIQRVVTSVGRQGGPTAKKGIMLHTRRFSDSDSGGSATFSIDFNRADNSHNNSQSNSQNNSLRNSQNESSLNPNEGGAQLDARESTGGSFFRERVDKENLVARMGQTPSKTSVLRASDQSVSSSDSNKHLRRSQEATHENRPVLGSMPFNNCDKNVRTSMEKNSTDLYNEDTRGERHPATTLQRALPKLSSRGIPGKIMGRSRSSV